MFKTFLMQCTEHQSRKWFAFVEELRREVARGFLDTHNRTNKNAAKALETASFSYALIE